MFRTKLEFFVIRRMLIIFLILTILNFIFVDDRFSAFIGLLLGSVFSISKFASYVLVFNTAIRANGQGSLVVLKSILVFILSHIIILLLMFAALKINIWLFVGLVAGILLVPFVLFINSITEVLKITHNNFE